MPYDNVPSHIHASRWPARPHHSQSALHPHGRQQKRASFGMPSGGEKVVCRQRALTRPWEKPNPVNRDGVYVLWKRRWVTMSCHAKHHFWAGRHVKRLLMSLRIPGDRGSRRPASGGRARAANANASGRSSCPRTTFGQPPRSAGKASQYSKKKLGIRERQSGETDHDDAAHSEDGTDPTTRVK